MSSIDTENSSSSGQNNPNNTFEAFNLPPQLADALVTIGYKIPTPIQEKGIPIVMQGKDLIGIAQTGTGKTAAFGIPMVKLLIEDKNSQGLILVPTRELAEQVFQVMKQLTQNVKSIKPWVLIGGTSMFAQAKSLPRMPKLIIATPGRLNDHLERGTFVLANVRMVVLDEADRMLDIGFEPQIRKVFPFLPKKRQTLLFSATFPKTIERLTREYMSEPAKLTIGRVSQPGTDIEQSFIQTTVALKNPLLIQELEKRKGSVLIFVRTKHRVDRVTKTLQQAGFDADRIHGARTQAQRSRVMSDFRNKIIRIMVATDVASRGIDISHIEHVINYDIPEVPEDYVHRIGRTARAGAKGESVSFLTPEDKTKWLYLSKHLMSMGIKLDSTMIKKAGPLSPMPMADISASDSSEQEESPRDYSQRRHGRPKYRPKQARLQANHPSSDRPKRPYTPASDYRSAGSDRPNSRPYTPRGDGSRTSSRPYSPRGDGERSNSRPYTPRADGERFNRSYAPRGDGGRSSRPYTPRGDSARPSRGYEGRSSEGNSRSYAPRGDGVRTNSRPYTPRGDGERSNRSYAPRGDGARSSRPYTPRSDGPRRDSGNGERPANRFSRSDGPRTSGGYGRPSSDRPRSDRPSYPSRSAGPRSEGSSFKPRGENFARGDSRSFSGPTNGSARPRPTVRPGKFAKKTGSYPRGNKPRDGSARPSRDS